MTVDNLTLEVTRRCNMCCAHCLRGDAQCMDMSKEIIDNVLREIDSIGTVFFTGGEPSLNIPVMEYFFEKAKENDVCIGSFGLVTNGKENQKQLAIFIAEHAVEVEEMEYCYVAMSRDQYHDPVEKNYLKAFSFYSDDKEFDYRDRKNVLAEGRGSDIPGSTPVHAYELSAEDDNSGLFVEDMLYISANGNVLSCCDFSYEHGDQVAYGNVLEESLVDIIRREINDNDKEVA